MPEETLQQILRRAQPVTEPKDDRNLAEKALAQVARLPVLPTVLEAVSRPANIMAKISSTLPGWQLAAAATGAKGVDRGARLREVGEDFKRIFAPASEQKHFSPRTLLSDIGIEPKSLGRLDIPGFGPVTGAGMFDLAYMIGNDPLVFTKIGGLTRAGRLAEEAGTLARAPLKGSRFGSALAEQVAQGQRSMLQFGGAPIEAIPGVAKVTAPIMEALEKTKIALASSPKSPFRGLARFGGRAEVQRAVTKAHIEGGAGKQEVVNAMREAWERAQQIAKTTGRDADSVFADIFETTEKFQRSAPKIARREAKLAEAVKLEEIGAKRLERVRSTMTSEERRLASDADQLIKEAGRIETDSLRHADRLTKLADRATREGEQALGDALNSLSERILKRADRRSARFQALADRAEGPLRQSLRGSAMRAIDDEIRAAESLVRQAVKKGAKPGSKLARSIESEAFKVLRKESKRAERLSERAARIEDTRLQLRDRRARVAGKVQRQAEKAFEQAADPRLQPRFLARMDAEAKRAVKSLRDQYVNQGYDNRTALRAARQSVLNPAIDPVLAPIAAHYDEVLRRIIAEEKARGVVIEHLADPFINYATRTFTVEAQNAMRKKGLEGLFRDRFAKIWKATHSSARKRKIIYEGQRLPEMEALMKEHFPDLEGRIFEVDPVKLALVRGRRLERAITGSDYFETTARDFGRPGTDELLKAGWESLDDIKAESGKMLKKGLRSELGLRAERSAFRGGESVPTRLSFTKNMVVPPEVAHGLRQVNRIIQNADSGSAFLKYWDGATRLFKTGVTIPWPAFHARNFISNLWLNFIGDVDPRRYADAIALMVDARRGGNRVWDFAEGMTTNEVLATMESGRALGFGASSAEEVGKLSGKIPVLGTMKKVGEQIEDFAKIAHFLDKMKKGMPVTESILSVKKYLFDYGDLSPFERSVMRRIVPFYTWQRKNWPLMLETLVSKPGKASALQHFNAAINAEEDGGHGLMTSAVPEWVRRRLFHTHRGEDGGVDIVSGAGLPLEDLAILDRPISEVLSMLNPMLKAPLQAAVNQDFFRDVPLDQSDIAPGVFRFMPQPFRDAISFREVKRRDGSSTGLYRASPRFLNFMWGVPVASGSSRLFNFVNRLERMDERGMTGAQETVRALTGIRGETISGEQQRINNLRLMLSGWVEDMERLQREGVAGELQDKFFLRRDIPGSDPKAVEFRSIQREIGRAKRMLSRLSASEMALRSRKGTRSLGAESR